MRSTRPKRKRKRPLDVSDSSNAPVRRSESSAAAAASTSAAAGAAPEGSSSGSAFDAAIDDAMTKILAALNEPTPPYPCNINSRAPGPSETCDRHAFFAFAPSRDAPRVESLSGAAIAERLRQADDDTQEIKREERITGVPDQLSRHIHMTASYLASLQAESQRRAGLPLPHNRLFRCLDRSAMRLVCMIVQEFIAHSARVHAAQSSGVASDGAGDAAGRSSEADQDEPRPRLRKRKKINFQCSVCHRKFSMRHGVEKHLQSSPRCASGHVLHKGKRWKPRPAKPPRTAPQPEPPIPDSGGNES